MKIPRSTGAPTIAESSTRCCNTLGTANADQATASLIDTSRSLRVATKSTASRATTAAMVSHHRVGDAMESSMGFSQGSQEHGNLV